MSLEEVYYVSQVVAAVAIIGSLIYLGVQTQQTSKNQRAMMHQSRVDNIRDIFNKIGDPAFAAIYRAGASAEPGMETNACAQFAYFARGQLNSLQELFLQRRDGMIDERRWNISRGAIRTLLTYPGYRALYKLVRGGLDPDFVALTDSILIETKDKAPPDEFALAWADLASQERATMDAALKHAST